LFFFNLPEICSCRTGPTEGVHFQHKAYSVWILLHISNAVVQLWSVFCFSGFIVEDCSGLDVFLLPVINCIIVLYCPGFIPNLRHKNNTDQVIVHVKLSLFKLIDITQTSTPSFNHFTSRLYTKKEFAIRLKSHHSVSGILGNIQFESYSSSPHQECKYSQHVFSPFFHQLSLVKVIFRFTQY
jgi:hypothetical protein